MLLGIELRFRYVLSSGLQVMVFERHHSTLIVASLVTVASFVGATAYTQTRLARLDALLSTIETNAVPSIDYLSRAAVGLTRLNQLLDEMSTPGPKRAAAVAAARQELPVLQNDVDAYVLLPPLPGERNFWAALRDDVGRAVQLVRQSSDAEDGGERGDGQRNVAIAADDAIDRALRSVLVTLDFDVKQAQKLAREVRSTRAATLRAVISLDSLATAVALVGLIAAYRASRSHDMLLREHNALLAARVHELDCFAGRVAHDVLSPLGTVAMGLSLLLHSTDMRGRTHIERSQRALSRVQQLVEALLSFARSGARPSGTESCSSDVVLKTVIADSSEAAADAGIELVLEAHEHLDIRCSTGVLTSICQNLIRNAIKYMGDRSPRRIVVRTKPVGSKVRIEVEDTGPGIPADLQKVVFEAFVRGPHEVVGGTGLGLATVKRLVESHGGCVGLQSTVGVGSSFWVELPLASDFPDRSVSTAATTM
jgi:signal transduction histidine kinase